MELLPNFLIIGTMKGGTTVLYDFINAHDCVVNAKVKEIHYFSLYPFKGVDWYLSHFKKEEGKIIGEASPTYFNVAYTSCIPMSIRALAPEIKLILIIRDPVERAVSHYIHYCKVNKIAQLMNTDINDFFSRPFEAALKQTSAFDIYLHDILCFSAYYRKYQNFRSVFERAQFLVLDNCDLKEDPQGTMKKTFEFLGLDPIESDMFNQFRYSTGSNTDVLSKENLYKLSEFLYPDYELFCRTAKIEYKPLYKS